MKPYAVTIVRRFLGIAWSRTTFWRTLEGAERFALANLRYGHPTVHILTISERIEYAK